MIDYIRGVVEDLQPAVAVVEACGIGYEVNITLSDFTALQRTGRQQQVRLFIHEVIRDDAHTLFGFLHREDRAMFRLLLSVSGVGPAVARLILSELSAAELQGVIASGNTSPLKAIKGIGARTAQRIIVDLCNKINDISPALDNGVGMPASTYDEALGGLTTLGFPAAAVQKMLRDIYKEKPGISTEDAIRAALKAMN